jgi:hypothetical protein
MSNIPWGYRSARTVFLASGGREGIVLPTYFDNAIRSREIISTFSIARTFDSLFVGLPGHFFEWVFADVIFNRWGRTLRPRLIGCVVALCWLAGSRRCFGATAWTSSGMIAQAAEDQASVAIGVLTGTVADPSGAMIHHAAVHVESGSLERDTKTDNTGTFSIPLPAGIYVVTIEADGFRAFTINITLSERTSRSNVSVKLQIAATPEEITVASQDSDSTAAADNKSALVFKADQLKDFSDDDSAFQREILALAGGEGPRPPEILVNGFSNGRFPPKTSIREIRVNQNPYTAEYDQLGYGRVEIYTKPGTDQLHGQLSASGTDNVFNAQNPYTTVEPPYYTLNIDGNLSGSFNKKTSFFVAGTLNDLQNNAIVNAIDPTLLTPLREAVPAPQITQTYSGRVDHQVTRNNSFMARYEFNRISVNNSGVGLLVLPTEGLNSTTTTNTLQLTDTQIIGRSIISEAHFQFARTHVDQTPVSTAATIVVEGSFNGGGAPAQTLIDNDDHYEFQEFFTIQHGTHYVRLGGRYRLEHRANENRSGYNGQFTFPDLATYELAAVNDETTAVIFASTGETIQYNVTAGQTSASLITGDAGVFAEDEWKIRKNFTLDYGFRFESQSAIPDHADPAPRLGIAWAVGKTSKRRAFFTLRGGAGIFYDRFASANILTAIRQQSGMVQNSYYVENPPFYPTAPSDASTLGVQPTLYNINPHLRNEYAFSTGVTAERRIGKIGSLSANYIFVRGVHQWLSRNINAPLPGTFNPADPSSGIRPLGGTQNIYQFDSGGVLTNHVLFSNFQFRVNKRINGFVAYSLSHSDQDVGNPTNFDSNSYNIAEDYGRSPQPTQQLFETVNFQLPFGLAGTVYGTTSGGIPFNITTGTDLNGDTIYNDRPAFATNPTANSVIYKTSYGTFDANPQPGEKTIPINYGNSPNFFFLQASLSRDFKLGPRPASTAPVPGTTAPVPRPDSPYTLTFSAEADNLLNHNNPGLPVGVLSSPYFGRSISLSSPFSLGGISTSANRTVLLHCNFSF